MTQLTKRQKELLHDEDVSNLILEFAYWQILGMNKEMLKKQLDDFNQLFGEKKDLADYEQQRLYNVTNWLKEIELDIPTDEELIYESNKIVGIATEAYWRHERSGFFNGAKYLREQITNQLKNK